MGYPQNGYMGDLGLSWNVGKTINKIVSNVKAVERVVTGGAAKAQEIAQQVQVASGATEGALRGAQSGAYAGGAAVTAKQGALQNPAVLIGGGLVAALLVSRLGGRR